MASAGSSFPTVYVAEALVNVDHNSDQTTTDHDELPAVLVGWDRRALSSEVVGVGEGVLVLVKNESA